MKRITFCRPEINVSYETLINSNSDESAGNEGGHGCERSQCDQMTRLLTCYAFEEGMVVDVNPAVAEFMGYDHDTGGKRLQRKIRGFCTTEEHTMFCHRPTLSVKDSSPSSRYTHSTNPTKNNDKERSKQYIYRMVKMFEENQGAHHGKHDRELPQVKKRYFEQRSFDNHKRHVLQKSASYDSKTAFTSTLNESKYSTTDVSSAGSAISMIVDVEVGVDESASSTGDGIQVFDTASVYINSSPSGSQTYFEESSLQTLDSNTLNEERNKTIVPEKNKFAMCVDSERTFDQYDNINKRNICESESVGERIIYNREYSSTNKLKNSTSTCRLDPMQIDVDIGVEAFGSKSDIIEVFASMHMHTMQQCEMSDFKSRPTYSVPVEKNYMVVPTECREKLCDGSSAFKESGDLTQIVDNTDGETHNENDCLKDGITNIIPCLATGHFPEGCETRITVMKCEIEDREQFQSVLENWKKRESVSGRDFGKKHSTTDVRYNVKSMKDKHNYNQIESNADEDDFEIIDHPYNENDEIEHVIDFQNEVSLSGEWGKVEPIADKQCWIRESVSNGLGTTESCFEEQPILMSDSSSSVLVKGQDFSDEHLSEISKSNLDDLDGKIPFQLGRELPIGDRAMTDKSKADYCGDEPKSGKNNLSVHYIKHDKSVQFDLLETAEKDLACKRQDLLRGGQSLLDSGCLRNADPTMDYLKRGIFLHGEADRKRPQRTRKIGRNILSDVGGLEAEHIVDDDDSKGRHESSKAPLQVSDALHDVVGKVSPFRDTLDETTTLVAQPSTSDYIWNNGHTTAYIGDRISYLHTPWKGLEKDASSSSLSQTISSADKRISMLDTVSEILKQIDRPYISKIGSDIVQNVSNTSAENYNEEPHKSMDDGKITSFLRSIGLHSFLNFLKPKPYLPRTIAKENVSKPVSSSSEQSDTDESILDEYEEIPKAKSSKKEIVTQFLTSSETIRKYSTFESEPQPFGQENTKLKEGNLIKRKTKQKQNGVSPTLKSAKEWVKNPNTKDPWIRRSLGDIHEEETDVESQSTVSEVESVVEEKDVNSATHVSRTFIGLRGYPTRFYPIALYFTCLVLVYLFWTVCYFSCTYTSYGFTRKSQAWYCRVYRYATDNKLYSAEGRFTYKSRDLLHPFRPWRH